MRVAVLGGGIGGLAAAHFAREHDVTLFESSPSVGGCIESVRDDDFVLEGGPDSLLAEKPAGLALIRALGLMDRVVATREEFRGAAVVRNGRLVKIPDGFRLFAPRSIGALMSSGLFSWRGIARAAMEPFVPARRNADDESLASFVTRRFGSEVLDRLAQPFIGGVYSGDPRTLSVNATMPQFASMERDFGSVGRGLRRSSSHAKGATYRGLVSLRGGLQTLTDELARELGDRIKTSHAVTALNRDGAGWIVQCANGSSAHFDAVICTLPAYLAADLLAPHDIELSTMLRAIRYHSIVTINIAYRASDIPALPRGTGFLVPFSEGREITATTFSTQKYPGRSPEGQTLLRSFVGGALQPGLLARSDDECVQLVRKEYRDLLGITADPTLVRARRWVDRLPEYAVGHIERTDAIEGRARALGNVALAGAAFYGAGIPDCIAGAERAVRTISPT